MSLRSLLSKRYKLCLACCMALIIITVYSSYNFTRNLPATLHHVTKAPLAQHTRLKKEDNTSCLKDAFHDILLVIVFNYPFYDSIPHLNALYRPAFPHILFCGPPHNTSRAGILTVDIYRGVLGYECLGRAMREHPGYRGYFYINDDVILNYWNFPHFDGEKIWESSSSFGSTPVYEPANSNWYWWISPYGLNNCRRAYEDVANMNLGTKKLNVKYHLSTLARNSNGSLQCFSGRSDILYIPRKHTRAFSILSETFYERKVFLEIAIPTMIRFLERNENIGRLPGYYIPGDVRRGDPRVTDSRFFWFVYFPKKELWFIHPFKLHGNEIDSKFNLAMLKFILLEKVKSLTDCKPTTESLS
ncbi:PREDICTED: uncharacterized protein LOC107341734 [Acropora digitifera]|uniref:uncharacterized protein LOC107341734 n=1 Tax=Acropora digitifera TaxID=70779 RepID=UPI00077AD73D|nr:PREDICTED: uncharacterized protein LOC107341734 [Acropora digitifera]